MDDVGAVEELATGTASMVDPDLEAHRGELPGYCYRMLGSPFEAEDAGQEALLRAWRATDSFEGRSTLRTWLYRIATNVCIDALRARKRRERPMDLGSASPASADLPAPLANTVWIETVPDGRPAPEAATTRGRCR